ncbi:hypothetical protein LCGC14_2926710, partial [marine sediment metagenome]
MNTFGQAMEFMKDGEKVRLPYWSEEVYISIQRP